MKGHQADHIRLIILILAAIGGLAFMLYLGINYTLARSADEQLNQLQERAYPRILALREVQRELESFRQALASAIAMQNQVLVELSLETGPDLKLRLSKMKALLGAEPIALQRAEQLLDAYLESSSRLAPVLAEEGENYERFIQAAESANAAFEAASSHLDGWEKWEQAAYQKGLKEINARYHDTQRVAIWVGLALIPGLFGLAWLASSRVLAVIKASDRLKESFLATISHELRTPLNGVTGALQVLKQQPLTDEQNEMLANARYSAMEMVKTVDEILTFTEFVSGAPRKNEHPFSLHDVLIRPTRIAERECQRRGLTFECDLTATEGVWIMNDEHKIVHVVRRLLENAVKFTAVGCVRFRALVHSRTDGRQSQWVTLVVSDTGPGVKPELVEALFKPFHQLDNSFSRKHGGLGMGLAICQALARCLEGSLAFEQPENGSGARVVFRFPCKLTTPSSTNAPEGAEREPALESPDQSRRVLVVEDNKVNQMVLSRLLKKFDVDVGIAENGQEAVERVQAERYDLILMDCQMPVMDGFEATRAIRALSEPFNRVPIVAVTANAGERDRERCRECGMDDFISKPVDSTLLETHLKRYLSVASAS